MKAMLCHAFGEPEALAFEETPAPVPAAGEILIRVAAAGVNFTDHMLIRGLRGSAPPFPFSPGMEVAGTVLAAGPGVDGFVPGARVVSFCRVGGYAEQVAAPAATSFPLPDDVDFIAAAGLLIGHGTAHYALHERGALQPGDTVLVLGAGGGVGLAAVEIGRIMGARVIAATSSPEKRQRARDAGAAVVLDGDDPDLAARVAEAAGPDGVDVIYDPVGADPVPLMAAMRWRGRYLVIGTAWGAKPAVPVEAVFAKELALLGVYFGQFMLLEPARNAANIATVLDWHRQGLCGAQITSTPPLEQAPAVLRSAIGRKLQGKTVLIA